MPHHDRASKVFQQTKGLYDNAIDPDTGVEYSDDDLEKLRKEEQESVEEWNRTEPDFYTQNANDNQAVTDGDANIDRLEDDPYWISPMIDPLTGFPFTKNDWISVQNGTRTLEGEELESKFTSHANYNIDVDDYSKYMDNIHGSVGMDELNRRRAVGQSHWDQAGNAVVRTVGTAVFDFVGGMASMLDFEDYYNQDDEVGNPISSAMNKAKEAMNEEFSIYRERPGESFDAGDPAWWFENGSSLVGSIGAFVGQGFVVGATFGAGSAALAANMGKWGAQLMKGAGTLGTAIGLNQSEAIMEAGTVYRDNILLYKSLGASESEAKAKAAADASDVVNINRANIALNLVSASMFTRAGRNSVLASREKIKPYTNFWSKEGLKVAGLETGQEFAEEQINFIAGASGSKAITGVNDDNIFEALTNKRTMGRHVKDPHFWEAGVLGAVGGFGQYAGTKAIKQMTGAAAKEEAQYAKQEQRIQEIDQMFDNINQSNLSTTFMKGAALQAHMDAQSEVQEKINKAISEGASEEEVDKLKLEAQNLAKQSLWDQTVMSLNDGTTGHLVNSYKRFADMTEEQREAKGLDEGAQKRAQEAVEFIEEMEGTWNDMAGIVGKNRQVRNTAISNRIYNYEQKKALKEIKAAIQEQDADISEERSLLSAEDNAKTDVELAIENETIGTAMKIKSILNKNFDKINKQRLKGNKSYRELLKDNFSKGQRKKFDQKTERIGRGRKAYEETLHKAIQAGKFDRNTFEQFRRSVALSNHPDRTARLEILDRLGLKLKEAETRARQEALRQEANKINADIQANIKEQANKLREELGLPPDVTEKLEEKGKKKGGKKKGYDYNKAPDGIKLALDRLENLYELPDSEMTDELAAEITTLEKLVDSWDGKPEETPPEKDEAPVIQGGRILTGYDKDGKAIYESLDPADETPTTEDPGPPNETLAALTEQMKQDFNERLLQVLEEAETSEEFLAGVQPLEDADDLKAQDKSLVNQRLDELKEWEDNQKERDQKQLDIQKEAEESQTDEGGGISTETVIVLQDSQESSDLKNDPTLEEDEEVEVDPANPTDPQDTMQEDGVVRTTNPQYDISEDAVGSVNTQFLQITLEAKDVRSASTPNLLRYTNQESLYVRGLDEDGNPIKKPATKYKIVPKHKIKNLAEKIESGEVTPIYWYPIKIDPKTGVPVTKNVRGMEKFLHNRKPGDLTPLLSGTLEGDALYMVNENPDDVILEEQVIDFEQWVDPLVATKGSKVVLRKGEYKHPKTGNPLYVPEEGKVLQQDPITIHTIDKDGNVSKPLQKLAAGDFDLRMNWDTYVDEDGNVEMFVENKNRGFVMNTKIKGESAKLPLSDLGVIGEDFSIGVGKASTREGGGAVLFWNRETNTWESMDAMSERGRLYAMIPSANGAIVPVRLETKTISRANAESVIDNILLNPKLDGEQKKAIIEDLIATKAGHNISKSENPKAPLFYVDNSAIKIKVGNQIIGVDHQNRGKHNNLRKALGLEDEAGNPIDPKQAVPGSQAYHVRIFQSLENSPEGNYGEQVMGVDPNGKAFVKREWIGGGNATLGATSEDKLLMESAINAFRENLIEAIMGKSYQVSKEKVIENGPVKDYTTGKEYSSYTEYLSDKEVDGVPGLVTTDVAPGQKFTDSKVKLVPIQKSDSVTNDNVATVQSETDTVGEEIKKNQQVVEGEGDSHSEVEKPGIKVDENSEENATVENTDIEGNELKEGEDDSPDIKWREASLEVENKFQENPGNILTEAEVDWIVRTFGPDHILPMANAKYIQMKGGRQAYGAYSNGLVLLARLGAKGTAYHESFHVVMDLATTEQEKKQVFRAMQEKYGTFSLAEEDALKKLYPKKTKAELEEIFFEEKAAELFREFMEAEESKGRIKKTKLGRIIQKIFDRIRKAILAIRIYGTTILNPDSIYLSSMTMERMFLKIKVGDFKISDATKAKMKSEKFNPNDAMLRSKPEWSNAEKDGMVESLRFGLVTKVLPKMIADGTSKAQSVEDILSKREYTKDLMQGIENLRETMQNYVEVLDKFIQKNEGKSGSETSVYNSKIKRKNVHRAIENSKGAWLDINKGGVVQNPGFKGLLLNSLRKHGVAITLAQSKEGWTVDKFEKIEKEALELGIPTVDDDGDPSTNSKERIHGENYFYSSPKKTMSWQVKTALSFIQKPVIRDSNKKIIDDGKSKFTGLPSFLNFDEVYADLASKLAGYQPHQIEERLKELAQWKSSISAVYQKYLTWDSRTKTAFRSNFSKTQLKFMTAVVDKNGAWELIETNRQDVQKQIVERWNTNRNILGLFNADGSINSAVLSNLGKQYQDLFSHIKNPTEYYKHVNRVFKHIGIEFEPNVLKMFETTYPPSEFQKTVVEGKFSHILKELGYNPSNKQISKGSNPYTTTGAKGQTKNFKKIAQLVQDVSSDLYTGSFTNGEGKLVYSINLNSYLSKLSSEMATKEGVEKIWETFNRDVYYNPDDTGVARSMLFSLLLDFKDSNGINKVREEFALIELDSTKLERGDEAITYDKMTPKQTWLTRLNFYRNNGHYKNTGYGLINTGTKSDKGRSLYIRVPLLASNKNKVPQLNATGGLIGEIQGVKNAAKAVLRRNVLQERARISRVHSQLFGENALPDSKLKENYHYKGKNPDGTLNREAANGLKFMSIPDLNFTNYNLFDSDGNVKFFNKTELTAVDKALDAFMERETLRSKRAMVADGVLVEHDGKFYSDEISPDKFSSSTTNIGTEENPIVVSDVDDAMTEFLLNDLVWRTEFSKYENGDLAYYKSTEKDISKNDEFPGAKGKFVSVVVDAGKRAYQSITPGLDHMVSQMALDSNSQDDYGKTKEIRMAIIEDIYSKMSLNRAANLAIGFTKNPSWEGALGVTGAKNVIKHIEALEEKINEETDKTKKKKLEKKLDAFFKALPVAERKAVKIVLPYRRGSNKSDAQGYTTLEAHKKTMEGRGEWTTEGEHSHEVAYNEYWTKESDPNTWPEWAQKLALKPLKTFSFGYHFDETLQQVVFTQIKHSTVPLYPAFTKTNPELDKLRRRMETTGEFADKGLTKIDAVNLESAVKVGKSGVTKYNNKSSAELENMEVHVLQSDNERSPFVLPAEKGMNPKDGSQIVKLITADMVPGAIYDSIEGIKELLTEDIKNVNDLVYVEKIKRTADKLSKELGWNEFKNNPNDPDIALNFLKKIQKLLLEQIESRELPDNYSLALEIEKIEGEIQFAMPLSFPAYAKKFEIALASIFKARVMTQRMPGDSAVQVAEYGLDETNDLGYYRFEDGRLKAAEVAISYQQANKLGLLEYVNSETGVVDYQAMERAGMDKSVLELVGYRIPTQGKSSMLPLIIKKVLPPTAKGQIVLPADITTQTGADFDVDKLNLFYPALEETGENTFQKVPVADKIEALKDGKIDVSSLTDKEIQNVLFSIRFGILTSKNHAPDVINPLDTDTYKNKMKEYGEIPGMLQDTGTFNFNSAYTDVYLESVNKDAKVLVGIFANHSVAHALSQDIDIQITDPKKGVFIEMDNGEGVTIGTKENPIRDLSGIYGFDGELRSLYLNEDLNASLDNAKDPITGSLNINTFTANIVAMFNRLGINNSIATDFINQPVIRELKKRFALDEHAYTPSETANRMAAELNLPTKGPNGKKIQYGAAEENRIKITPEGLRKSLGKDISEMAEEEPGSSGITGAGKHGQVPGLQFQKQVLMDFVKYWDMGSDLAKSNKMLAPDRFTAMSGLSDIELWLNNKNFVESGEANITVKGVYPAKDAVTKQPVGPSSSPRLNAYYEHAILGAEEVISEFMPYNSDFFLRAKKFLAEMTHQKNGTFNDKKLIERMNSDIYSFIMFTQGSPVAALMNQRTKEESKKKLFKPKEGESNQTVAQDLTNIKYLYNLGENKLLKYLSGDIYNGSNKFQMVRFNNAASYTQETKSAFVDAFYELFYHTERNVNVKWDSKSGKHIRLNAAEKQKAVEHVKKVMTNLVDYSIRTSGFQSGPNSFVDLIPLIIWKSLGEDIAGNTTASLSKFLKDLNEGSFKTYFPYLAGRDSHGWGYLSLEEQDSEGRDRKAIEEDKKIEALAVPELLMQILRNRISDPKLIKKVRADQVSPITMGYTKSKRHFIETFSVGEDSNLFVQGKKGSAINGFPQVVTMWDKNSKKRRGYRKLLEGGGATSKNAFAHYTHMDALGEQNKFFEVYPEEINPESIHPDNTDVDTSGPPAKPTAGSPDPTVTTPGDNTNIVATDNNIVNKTVEEQISYEQGETNINLGDDMDELEVRGSKEFTDAMKKAQEDGDSQIKCNE